MRKLLLQIAVFFSLLLIVSNLIHLSDVLSLQDDLPRWLHDLYSKNVIDVNYKYFELTIIFSLSINIVVMIIWWKKNMKLAFSLISLIFIFQIITHITRFYYAESHENIGELLVMNFYLFSIVNFVLSITLLFSKVEKASKIYGTFIFVQSIMNAIGYSMFDGQFLFTLSYLLYSIASFYLIFAELKKSKITGEGVVDR